MIFISAELQGLLIR